MTFTSAIATCFRKYADFSGRARRSEYWKFILFTMIIEALSTVIFSTIIPLTACVCFLLTMLSIYCICSNVAEIKRLLN